MSGEDTELFARIIAQGGKMGFVPDAIVHHLIGPERMSAAVSASQEFRLRVWQCDRRRQEPQSSSTNWRKIWPGWSAAALRGDREGVIYHQLECANFLGYWRGRLTHR